MGKKFTDLPASSGLASADLFAVTDDPSGTAASQKLTGSQLLTYTQTSKLSDFATTTSAELAGVISDETGSGALVFANTPTLATPVLGAATGTSLALNEAAPFADLHVQGITNVASTFLINDLSVTVNGTNSLVSILSTASKANIASGITDSGYRVAVTAASFINDTDFLGTLANQRGLWARHGINAGSGTITDSYGVYIERVGAGTITNSYGLYQAQATDKNYFAGQVGFGATSPVASALVEMTSTTQGFLSPRMTTTQRDAISSPAEGLVIYNTTTKVLNFYNGTAWGAV